MVSDHWNEIIYRAAELMEDLRWHPWDKTIKELVGKAPPGPAIRRCEQNRKGQFRKRNGVDTPIPPRVKPLTRDEQIASGARSLVREVLCCEAFERRTRTLPDGTKLKEVRMKHVPRRAELERKYRAEAAAAERQRIAEREGKR